MSYEINYNNVNLKLTLNSDTANPSSLKLRTYVNDSDTYFKEYTPIITFNESSPSYTLVYNIALSEYNIGDVITKFYLTKNQSVFPWQTHEGVTILLDGEEVDTINTNVYTTKFDTSGEHTIQAVYKGNSALNMAVTDEFNFNVTQPPVDESGTVVPDTGTYKLNFVDKGLDTIYYNDGTVYRFRLTKGGVPVKGKVIEVVSATGGVGSHTTDKNGIVTMNTTDKWVAGKYKIGAYFTEDSKTITSVYKNIVVKKRPTTITMNTGSFEKGSKIKFYFKSNKTPLTDTKVQLFVNGKVTNETTNSKGIIYYTFNSKGTYKFKAVYKGDKNHTKGEFETTVTIG